MGQPVRRRHDRADRLLVRLLCDADCDCCCARHRFPLPAVLSQGQGAHRPGRHPGRGIGRRAAGRPRLVGDVGATIGALLPLLQQKPTDRIWRRRESITPRRARRSTIWPWARPASTSSIRNRSPGNQRPSGRRRRLHLRCRPADGLGRALPGHERQAAADRVVLARLDGQCAGEVIGAQAAFPGRQMVSLSGDGGFSMLMGDFLKPRAAWVAGEGRRVQQRRARLHRARAELAGFLDIGPSSRIPISRRWPKPSASAGSGSKTPARSMIGIAAALAHDGPVLVDAVVNRSELAMPPSVTMEMAKGFTLYMVRR